MRKTKPKRHPLNWIIFPKFQLPLILVNLLVGLILPTIIWVAVENAFTDLKPIAGLSGFQVEFYKNFLNYQVRTFQITLAVASFLWILTSTLVTVVITHRFAGPLVRMRNHFKSIGDGVNPIPHLEFRDGDYFSEFPKLVNKAIEKIESRR